jgi:hypothetical protein
MSIEDVRTRLSRRAPEDGAALLMHHATNMIHESSRLIGVALARESGHVFNRDRVYEAGSREAKLMALQVKAREVEQAADELQGLLSPQDDD